VERLYRRERDLMDANAKLETLSQRDPLTTLYNRRHLMERLEGELARVRRGQTLTVVMIDLDGFKRVNDSHGHIAGDALLQALAQALASATRTTDVLGRYGGDEFVVLLPGTTGEAARTAAQRLVDAVRQVGQEFSREHPVTASVGLSEADAGDDARGSIQRADERAYLAKKRGGDRVEA
jgi:diguanylate cyclase (GGDEF)-like protein